MTRQIEEIQRKSLPLLKKAGVLRSSIFGSAARGELTETSDVDFLVEFEEGKSLFDLVRLKQELESALQREVDVITYDSIFPDLKETVEQEQVKIL